MLSQNRRVPILRISLSSLMLMSLTKGRALYWYRPAVHQNNLRNRCQVLEKHQISVRCWSPTPGCIQERDEIEWDVDVKGHGSQIKRKEIGMTSCLIYRSWQKQRDNSWAYTKFLSPQITEKLGIDWNCPEKSLLKGV
jgi:hypothetical protein